MLGGHGRLTPPSPNASLMVSELFRLFDRRVRLKTRKLGVLLLLGTSHARRDSPAK